MKIKDNIRIKAVKEYLLRGTLENTASIFKIHRNTLWRWVKWYKSGGVENLKRKKYYSEPWNRTSHKVENKLIALKEKIPSLTIQDAKNILEDKGIKISKNGIWNIWQRYGYIGFVKEQFSTSHREYLTINTIHPTIIKKIRKLINDNNVREAAKVFNSLPVFNYPEIIKKIPIKLLSLCIQADQLNAEFRSFPLSVYQKKTGLIRKKMEEKEMYYSALRAGVTEGYALMFLGKFEKLLELIDRLKKIGKGIRDPGINFAIFFLEGTAFGSYLRIADTLKCIKKCKTIIKQVPCPYNFMASLGALYSRIGYYREATHFATESIKGIKENYRGELCIGIAVLLTTKGKYKEALKFLKQGQPENTNSLNYSQTLLIKACACLSQGKAHEASSLAKKALLKSKKIGIRRDLHTATFILACSYAVVGNMKEAKSQLRRYTSLLKKYHFKREYLMRQILLGNIDIPEEALLIPSFRLAYLLYRAKKSNLSRDYRNALTYAHTQKLFGLFERLVLFFPEPVEQLFRKGKDSGLPKEFSKMPVFNKEIPVYEIKFLGNMIVYKNQEYLKTRMIPKDRAFLIQLVLKIGEPDKSISLDKIYNNFWKNSKNPARNLSHLLVRIKKELNIPSHLFEISNKWNNPVLINKGIHFITDYGEYQTSLTQGNALLRSGEWGFAKREYLKAFKLFRGEPFKKMYDNWSEDKRMEVLFSYETEVLAFVKELKKRGRKEEAKKLLKKSKRIIPDNEFS